ncbi:MAG: carboxylating nicotinate-nucleotide diphosphorylase [Candidatus Margulisiibacteriota bacterium]
MKDTIRRALKEDIGKGDITTICLVPSAMRAKAVIIAKEDGVVAGVDISKLVFSSLNRKVSFVKHKKDGQKITKGDIIASLSGPAAPILSGERVALNFLQRLSGIATLTDKFAKLCAGTGAKILDTRKTTPNLRRIEKFAVKMGGGVNHRMGLYDAVLIKDNHLVAEPDIKKAVTKARKTGKSVEIEVKNFSELKSALKAMPDRILLDNMSAEKLKKAVKTAKTFSKRSGKKIFLEASGGINLTNVKRIAKSGVDLISVGALTHSPKALDISLEIIKCR